MPESWAHLVVDDPIVPVSITHDVDVIVDGGVLEQHYNFIDYLFERDGVFSKARVYLDEESTAIVYDAYADSSMDVRVDAPELLADIAAYLKRRYNRIELLGSEGRKLLWQSPSGVPI